MEFALAYIGPGAGIMAIGTVEALLGEILLAIVGLIWQASSGVACFPVGWLSMATPVAPDGGEDSD